MSNQTMSVSGTFNMIDLEILDYDEGTSMYRCVSHRDSNVCKIDENDVISLLDLDTATTFHATKQNFVEDTGCLVGDAQKTEPVDYGHVSAAGEDYIMMNDLFYDIDAQDDFGDIELLQNRCLDIKREVDPESENEYEADEYDSREDPDEDNSVPATPNLPPFVTAFGRNRSESDCSEDSGYESPFHTEVCKKKRKRSKVTRLWEFLADVLGDPRYCPMFLEWIDKNQGIFRFRQSKKVAELWGEAKNKKRMPYEHLSRALRHYYKRDILYRIPDRRLVYQFGPNAEGWRMRAKLV